MAISAGNRVIITQEQIIMCMLYSSICGKIIEQKGVGSYFN